MHTRELIGREYELAHLRALVASGARLITVVGPGGCGKTHLVESFLHTASHGDPPVSVVFCDLTTASSPQDFVRLLATAAGIELTPSSSLEPALDAIARDLEGRGEPSRPAIVALDNFEPLVAQAAPTVGPLLTNTRCVQIVVTSRERLELPLETCLELGPLAHPEAVRLFLGRARSVRPDFEPSPDDEALVARLVDRLDRLPLALLLAAARLADLSLEEVDAGLRARFELLRDETAESSVRHANLRTTLGWSWHSLSASERQALAQCAVFRGSFSPTAAEAVVRVFGPNRPDALKVADLLEALRHKSLLQEWSTPSTAPGGTRYRLLETIRELVTLEPVWLRLRADCQLRHARYYTSCAEALSGDPVVRADARTREWFQAELENLFAAVDNVAEPQPELAARALIALFPMLEPLAIGAQHMALANRAVEAAVRSGAASLQARAYTLRAKVHPVAGHLGAAADDCQSALLLRSRSKELDQAPQRALNAALLAYLRLMQGRPAQIAEARRRYRQAEQTLRQVSPTSSDGAAAWLLLAVCDAEWGAPARAIDKARRALAVLRDRAEARRQGAALNNLGDFALDLGDFDLAEQSLREALALYARHDLEPAGSLARTNLGILAHRRGDLREAAGHYHQARSMAESAGDARLEAFVEGYRGVLAAEEGDLDSALARIDRAARALERLDYGSKTRIFLAYAGAVHLLGGDTEAARAHLSRAGEGFRPHHNARVAACLGALERAIQASPEPVPPADTPQPSDAALLWRIARSAGQAGRSQPLAIASDGSWFVPPGHARIHLGRRKAARLLLLALAEHAASGATEALGVERLFAAGWPGVNIAPESARKRVYTTIHDLRTLGLGDLLITRGDGYLLAAPIAFVGRSESERSG